ncbi:MAG: hypothetical protein ACOYJG_09965 [Prevotella sp.]|jgi:hypothetical protein
MRNFTLQGLWLSLKWVTMLQGRHLVKMFCVQVIALLLLLFLFTQNWLVPESNGGITDKVSFETTVINAILFCFILLAPFMVIGTLYSLLSAHSRQLHLMMPSTTAERYAAHIVLAVVWCLVVYPLSFLVADLLRWLIFAAFGKGSLGFLLTFDRSVTQQMDLLWFFSIDSHTDLIILSAWILYVAGGWWCALCFPKHWLVAFGLLCVAYPCLLVMPASIIFYDEDTSSNFFLIVNLLLLIFVTWHSWSLFSHKRLKKTT